MASKSTADLALRKYQEDEIKKAVESLTKEQLEELREAFKAYDQNGDGILTLAEIAGVMKNLGQNPSIPELRSMMNKVDANSDGEISFEEFCQLMAIRNAHNQPISEESLKGVFNRFDHDKSGQINTSELKAAMESLGYHLNDKEVEEMLKQADVSGDGLLDWEEFRDMIMKKDGNFTGRWGRLREMLNFTSIWKPRIIDPEELQKAREKARLQGKVLKELTFIRHGQSQANLEYDLYHKDLFHWDPPLTDLGREQARDAAVKLKEQNMKIELIVVSPLPRALQTGLIVLEEEIRNGVPVIAHPLATEQVTGSDDIGNSFAFLKKQYPQVDWSLMPDKEVWFWTPSPVNTIEEARAQFQANPQDEPWECVVARAASLEEWLAERPEKVIAVVAHGDLLEAMTGSSLKNAQSFMMEVKARVSHPNLKAPSS